MLEEFYYVYNPKANKPRHKHLTYESALEEAKRLATEIRDEQQEFLILKAVSSVSYQRPISVTNFVELPF